MVPSHQCWCCWFWWYVLWLWRNVAVLKDEFIWKVELEREVQGEREALTSKMAQWPALCQAEARSQELLLGHSCGGRRISTWIIEECNFKCVFTLQVSSEQHFLDLRHKQIQLPVNNASCKDWQSSSKRDRASKSGETQSFPLWGRNAAKAVTLSSVAFGGQQ